MTTLLVLLALALAGLGLVIEPYPERLSGRSPNEVRLGLAGFAFGASAALLSVAAFT